MGQKMKNLVIHTTDTPYDREVTPDDIYLWHMGAKYNGDGTYNYLGHKINKSQIENLYLPLPSGKRVKVLSTNGRGWSQVGYSDMIDRKGNLINLVPYSFDDVIDSFEVTNGASGYNSNSRHIVLAGGWSKDGKTKSGIFEPEEIYTKEQIDALKKYIRIQREMVPSVKIIGHNEISQKTCPNFDVQKFIKNHIM